MNSEVRGSALLSLFAIVACVATTNLTSPAYAKVWSIDERQVQLMQDINKGQKLNQLTPKEAKKLREGLSDIARKKKKFQNGDPSKAFSDTQKSELESDLNKVSTDIKKVELEKRVQK
jgi:Skp family chaperone for outer membrane proteins